MGRGWNRSMHARRARAWVVALVAVGAMASFLALAAPVEAAPLPATTTALGVDRSQALPGDAVLLTATVAVVGAPGTTPSGSVTFKRGTITIGVTALTDGIATLSATDIPLGSRSLTATYGGSSTLGASTSPARTVLIAKGASTTTVNAPASTMPGQPVALSATVAGPDADHPAAGTVTFKRGSVAIGTADVANGAASLTAALPAGTLAVSAVYNGSASLDGSVSAPTTVTVTQAPTATVLQVDTTLAGAPASLTATVTAPGVAQTPSGKVTFRRGTTAIGVVDLDGSGTARLSAALPAGSTSLTATYGGSTALAGSVSAPTAVDLQKAATTTALAIDPGPVANAGDLVTLTATPAVEDGRVPTGNVTFRRGTSQLGSVALVDGTATLTTSTLPVGTLAISATYNGSTTLLASTSATATLDVVKQGTIAIPEVAPGAVFGEPVAITATVLVPGSTRIPNGSVTFLRGTTTIGTLPLDGTGSAQLTTADLPVGFHLISVRHNGSGLYFPTTSPGASTMVSQAATAVSVDPFTPPAAAGEPVSLRATVTASAPSGAVPAGRVTFRSGTTTLGQVTLVAGAAELTTTALPAGATAVTASYGGNASFLPSSLTFESVLDAPTDVTVEPGRASVLVSFSPPARDGGSPIAGYTVTGTDLTDTEAPSVTAAGPWAPIELAGLTPGHSYSFVVEVQNEAGATATSDPSAPATPLEPCPAVDGTTERSAAAPGVDWHGCDLGGADLSGLDLSGADLADARLGSANLTATDLGGADLRRSDLRNADLEGADLAGTQIEGAAFSGLRSGAITGTPASLPSNTYLIDGYLIGNGASLQDAQLPGADLAGRFLGGSASNLANYVRVDLHGASLRGAFMSYADLTDADLTDVDLHGAFVLLTKLRGADLTGADLTGARLGGSDLTGANLTDADLTGADLSSPPPYPQIDLTGVIYCRTTLPSGQIDNSGCPA